MILCLLFKKILSMRKTILTQNQLEFLIPDVESKKKWLKKLQFNLRWIILLTSQNHSKYTILRFQFFDEQFNFAFCKTKIHPHI